MGARNTTMSSDTSSSKLDSWVTTKVDCSHGFKELPAERDEQIEADFNSSEFECFGHRWHLHVYDYDDDAVVKLCHSSKEKIDVMYNLRMINFEGRLVANSVGHQCKFEFDGEKSPIPLYVKWSKIAKVITKGELVVEVQMKQLDTSSAEMEDSVTIMDGWVTTIVDCHHGFKDLPVERYHDVEVMFKSQVFKCFGY